MTSSSGVHAFGSATISFGELLRQLRKRNAMTQAGLAAAVGYSIPLISNLELNKRLPDVQVVAQRFVPALGLHQFPQLADRLIGLAATARGERTPALTSYNSDSGELLTGAITAVTVSLPAPPTQLVGRAQEVKKISKRLLEESGRLLTLVGPPGIGKTRLALAVAETAQLFFRDGVYFVALAAIDDAELVAPTLANALGVDLSGEKSAKTRLIDFLRRKEVLLLLDNFEQIIGAATMIAELLITCPALHILVTSRERLHLRAEQRYRVPPLDLDAAVTLFAQRVQAFSSAFELTPENRPIVFKICHLLDGLPLAIELSAARIDLFTPELLLARLQEHRLDLLNDGARDLPDRQRTLRNAIQRSYLLLNRSEQSLFRAVGIFAGGFDTEAVVALGGDEGTLQSLINKSMVQVADRHDGRRRFLLLETLRDYACEQLFQDGEAAAVQGRHAAFYLQLAEEAASNLRGPSQALWIERLDLEQANVRAALASSLANHQSEIAIRLGIAFWRFWELRGDYTEASQWLERLCALPGETKLRAGLFYGRAMLARRSGDLLTAAANLTASLAFYRELEDRRGMASALRGLGFIHFLRHEHAAACPLFEEALTHFRSLDDLEGIAVTLDNLGYIATHSEEKRRLYQESLALRRRTGNLRGITMSLSCLAFHAIRQADFAAARRYQAENMQISEKLGNQNGIANALLIAGKIAAAEGDFATARLYFEKDMMLCQATGDRLALPDAIENLGMTMVRCGEIERSAPLLEQALLIYQEQGVLLGMARLFAAFATLAMAQRQPERALSLASAALVHCESLAEEQVPIDRMEFEHTQTTARQLLSLHDADAAWAAGQAMTREQAVAFAIAVPLPE